MNRGPTAAFVPVVLLIIEKHSYGGLIVATVIAGLLQIVMGLARMGTLIKFIPWPVTSGSIAFSALFFSELLRR
jgi:SulP family sulfate permease